MHVSYLCRRDGPDWFESRVVLATAPLTATPSENCTSGEGGDYCSLRVELVFPPGVNTATVVVPLLDDRTPETSEMFSVALSTPSDAVVKPSHSVANVTISDKADCELVVVQWTLANPRARNLVLTCASSYRSVQIGEFVQISKITSTYTLYAWRSEITI